MGCIQNELRIPYAIKRIENNLEICLEIPGDHEIEPLNCRSLFDNRQQNSY